MHHPTDRITHTTAFVKTVVEHWLEQEIAWWIHLEGSIRRPIAPWANALTTELHLAPCLRMCWWSLKASVTQCWVCWTFTLLCSLLKRLPTSCGIYNEAKPMTSIFLGGWGRVRGCGWFVLFLLFELFCFVLLWSWGFYGFWGLFVFFGFLVVVCIRVFFFLGGGG